MTHHCTHICMQSLPHSQHAEAVLSPLTHLYTELGLHLWFMTQPRKPFLHFCFVSFNAEKEIFAPGDKQQPKLAQREDCRDRTGIFRNTVQDDLKELKVSVSAHTSRETRVSATFVRI